MFVKDLSDEKVCCKFNICFILWLKMDILKFFVVKVLLGILFVCFVEELIYFIINILYLELIFILKLFLN